MKSDETSEIKLKEYKKQYKEWKSEIEKSHQNLRAGNPCIDAGEEARSN